jgi:hypothetical protein
MIRNSLKCFVESAKVSQMKRFSTQQAKQRIQGIIPPICTPFVNEEISWKHLANNIRIWETIGFSGKQSIESNQFGRARFFF